jgi:hypothetical protein
MDHCNTYYILDYLNEIFRQRIVTKNLYNYQLVKNDINKYTENLNKITKQIAKVLLNTISSYTGFRHAPGCMFTPNFDTRQLNRFVNSSLGIIFDKKKTDRTLLLSVFSGSPLRIDTLGSVCLDKKCEVRDLAYMLNKLIIDDLIYGSSVYKNIEKHKCFYYINNRKEKIYIKANNLSQSISKMKQSDKKIKLKKQIDQIIQHSFS